jgi:hypothetical protein
MAAPASLAGCATAWCSRCGKASGRPFSAAPVSKLDKENRLDAILKYLRGNREHIFQRAI